MIQPLLLAAGRSLRFGGNKLLHPLPDGTPVALAAARSLAAALPDALAVVNAVDAELATLLAGAGLRVSVCPRANEGMGRSLAWGVAQTPKADGWLIALADMPYLSPVTIRSVAQALAGPMTIIAPVHDGRRGHPIAFGRGHRQALAALEGDSGARALLQAHADHLILLPCADPGILRDIDRAEDLAAPPSQQLA